MAEYIDREAVISIINTAGFWEVEDREVAITCVEQTKAADVAEVKHGKWVWNPNGIDWGLGAWQCSECACRNSNIPTVHRINPLRYLGTNFCPNCGARMNLEE